MGDFDFLGDSASKPTRTIVYQKQRSSGCLSVIQTALGILLAVAIMVGGCVALIGLGVKEAADQHRKIGKELMKDIQKDVAADVIRQYNTVIENDGSEIDANVRAGMVAEAYLQAGDDENYRKWKKIANGHAKKAGIPIQ